MTLFGADIPFVDHCGIEGLDFTEGRTHLRLRLAAQHLNHLGIAHGGVLCTLLDVAMGTVARRTVGRSVMTLDLQVAFLAPGRGTLLAEGRIVRTGRSVVFCEADVRDEAGGLVARATGLMKPVRDVSPEAPQSTSAA